MRRYAAADGRALGDVDGLGDVVAIAGLTADRDTGRAFAVVDSFVPRPRSTASPRVRAPRHRGSSSSRAATAVVPDMAVSQLEYPSLDGTTIGLFLIHRRDVTPGPDVPCILNGYGGFAITETPVWSPQIAAWCAAGGIVRDRRAPRRLRGRRGLAPRRPAGAKQNVFDDFHAGADWLVSTGLASRDRLAVLGRSNGGLLVGVAMTQRPDLCRAVWCGVPLLDMVRFPQFLIARLWTSEYGDPDVAEEFGWLHAYSPYHHVNDGTVLPGHAVPDRRGRHARRPAARPQDGRPRPGRDDVPGRPTRSCCSRRTAPATASASPSPSGPTSSPTA